MTARKMCDALQHFAQALKVITQTETLTENEENIFVHELSLCYLIEHIVAQNLGIEIRQETDEVVDRFLHRCGMDDKSASVVSRVVSHDSMKMFEYVMSFYIWTRSERNRSISWSL